MLNKAVTKYSFLVGSAILAAAILLLTVGPVMSGTYKCLILPSIKEDRDYYCTTCGLAFALCDIKPTPGFSGCTCAEDFCTKWIDNDICDWSFGIHVCKAVCKDVINMPICNQVSGSGTSVSSTGIPLDHPVQPFPFSCCGYVPKGGCCDDNSDCATGKCNDFNAACPGYKSCSCSNETQPCMSDKDCCGMPSSGLTCNLNPSPISYETKNICSYCTGRVNIGLSKYTAVVYETLTAYTTGLNVKCDGRPVSIKMDSCNGGTEIAKCNFNKNNNNAFCSFSIGKTGTYNIFACSDLNGDGYFSDTESAMTYLTVTAGFGGGGSRGRPMMISTAEGLNNPIVILVALIAIVVIIYGAFKFLAIPKKRR
jgi:hypothetical protein